MSQIDKKGRNKYEHGTYLKRSLMSTHAWRHLSPKAQVLYIWLRFEWKGANLNNNGKIRLSCRQAADRIGIGVNAAMKAFHELQSKGFIVVTEMGALGVKGLARGPSYELTEIALPTSVSNRPRCLYLNWKPGKDFEVTRHRKQVRS